jgi:hypothetical protein
VLWVSIYSIKIVRDRCLICSMSRGDRKLYPEHSEGNSGVLTLNGYCVQLVRAES